MAKLLDIFACKECERAIFLNLEDRAADRFVCPHCQHDQSREEAMKSYEAEQVVENDEAPVFVEDDPNFPDVLECESCNQAIKISAEERSMNALNCPSCSASLSPSNIDQKKIKQEVEKSPDSGSKVPLEQEEKKEVSGAGNPEHAKELPDLISCNNCDRALFVLGEQQSVGVVKCGHCGHEHGSDALKQIAGEQAFEEREQSEVEAVPEPTFPELLECTDCQRAIKLLPDQRDAESTSCPYCETLIIAPEPELVVEEPESFEEPEMGVTEELAESENDTESVDSVIFDDNAPQDEGESLQSEKDSGDKSSLFENEAVQVEESAPEETVPDSKDVALSEDGDDVDEQTEENQEVDEVDTRLLERLIESSRNQSPMPECFNCPECVTEIVLPEMERMVGLCFCPECEELIDSNTAQENVSEKAEFADPPEEQSESLSGEQEEVSAIEDIEEKLVEEDVKSSTDDTASKIDFWLDDVLKKVLNCAKCDNSLKLDDEEKIFGIYCCPYCKAYVNHLKGETVLSILGPIEEEGEDDSPKRKPIKINFRALMPYAALLVFAAGLIFGVIKTADYIYDRKIHAAELVSKINGLKVHMEGRTEIFGNLLDEPKIKTKLEELENLSISELEEFEKIILADYRKDYEVWFENEGEKVETVDYKVNPGTTKSVAHFRKQLKQFNISIKLAKMDAENLATAMGLSKFERLEGNNLIKGHVAEIKRLLSGISTHDAIKNGLVAPRVVQSLMTAKTKIEVFEVRTARDVLDQFEGISKEVAELAKYFPVDDADAVGTPWNGEISRWREAKSYRDKNASKDWNEVVSEFRNLENSLREFHNQLDKARKRAPEEFSDFNHAFLDGGAFRSELDAFQNLDGVRNRKLVSREMLLRLEGLANELNPSMAGSLSHRIRVFQSSASKISKKEVEQFYEYFNDLWEPFLIDQEWFKLGELSSYYHLAKPKVTMMSRSSSTNE